MGHAPIGDIAALQYLTLQSDALNDVSFLSKVRTLVGLTIAASDVADLSALSALPVLDYVSIAASKVTDLSPLVANLAFAENCSLSLGENPLDCAAQATNIKALKDRGVEVTTDCP